MAITSSHYSLSALLILTLVLRFVQRTSATSTLSLDLCPLNSTDFIANTNITWGAVLSLPIRDLGGSSYLRPDVGGALLPWVYTIIVIIAHVPVVVVRVVRWQMVQTWSLAATVLTVVITVQGYKSTSFAPDMILTWTPLLLVIDAGSMAQVLFLIIEDRHLLSRLWQKPRYVFTSNEEDTGVLLREVPRDRYSVGTPEGDKTEQTTRVEEINLGQFHGASIAGTAETFGLSVLKDEAFYVATLAFLLFIAVVALQIIGLTRAIQGHNEPTPQVSSCSPALQPFGITVLDGNCNIYNVEQNFQRGVGCIYIPGTRQMSWLKATAAGTSLALIFEAIDICLLSMVHSKTRWRGMKMRRPWCSMIGGLAVLALLLIYGISYASTLPPGISERIWVVQMVDEPSVWTTNLVPAGMRGALIGWNDGIFNSWQVAYYGPSILP